MTALTNRKVDEAHHAKVNFWIQTVLLVPFLAIFGFSLFNIATGVVFLILAVIRMVWPYSEKVRKTELYLAIVLTVAWVLISL